MSQAPPFTNCFADLEPNSCTNPNGSSEPATESMLCPTVQVPAYDDMYTKAYVEHNYKDHFQAPIYRPQDDGSSKRRGPRGGVLVPFPERLHQMLNHVSVDGLEDVVSWQPHGRCFVVHQPERFVDEVMPR